MFLKIFIALAVIGSITCTSVRKRCDDTTDLKLKNFRNAYIFNLICGNDKRSSISRGLYKRCCNLKNLNVLWNGGSAEIDEKLKGWRKLARGQGKVLHLNGGISWKNQHNNDPNSNGKK
jgi:hypothetical protein